MLLFRPGEALGEFTDVTGADQLTHTRVAARRQCPAIACCGSGPGEASGHGHVLLCPGTHQGMVRGSTEHGLGIDVCGGSGISGNVASCRG